MKNGSDSSKPSLPADPQLRDLLDAREEAREALGMLGDVDEEYEERTTVTDMRPVMESTGELVIDASKKTTTLRAPPWVLAIAVLALAAVLLRWLA